MIRDNVYWRRREVLLGDESFVYGSHHITAIQNTRISHTLDI